MISDLSEIPPKNNLTPYFDSKNFLNIQPSCPKYLIILVTIILLSGCKFYGSEKTFYSTGQLKTQNHYKFNKLEGISREFYKNGRIKSAHVYHNGVLNGQFKLYYENGVLAGEGLTENGKQQGKATTYYETGKIKVESTHKDDQVNGAYHEYYESGQLHKEGFLVGPYQRQSGTLKEYDMGGILRSETTLKSGDIIANKTYGVNGQLTFEMKEGETFAQAMERARTSSQNGRVE